MCPYSHLQRKGFVNVIVPYFSSVGNTEFLGFSRFDTAYICMLECPYTQALAAAFPAY